MPTPEQLAERFEEHRPHLRAVAYRMLGSASARRERRRRTGRDVLEERSVQISLSSSTGILGCRAAPTAGCFPSSPSRLPAVRSLRSISWPTQNV